MATITKKNTDNFTNGEYIFYCSSKENNACMELRQFTKDLLKAVNKKYTKKLFTVDNCLFSIDVYENDLVIVVKAKESATENKYETLYISMLQVFEDYDWFQQEDKIRRDFNNSKIPLSYEAYVDYMKEQVKYWIRYSFMWSFVTSLEQWKIQRHGARKSLNYYLLIMETFIKKTHRQLKDFLCDSFLNKYKAEYTAYINNTGK